MDTLVSTLGISVTFGLDLVDNCIGINNRRYFIFLFQSLSILSVLAIYPLSLLEGLSSYWYFFALSQLIQAFFGSVGLIFYTGYLWYTCLFGIYKVDYVKPQKSEHPLPMPVFLSPQENVLITFGISTWQHILSDSFCVMIGMRLANKNFEDITEFRPLPLKGLEWSFIK